MVEILIDASRTSGPKTVATWRFSITTDLASPTKRTRPGAIRVSANNRKRRRGPRLKLHCWPSTSPIRLSHCRFPNVKSKQVRYILDLNWWHSFPCSKCFNCACGLYSPPFPAPIPDSRFPIPATDSVIRELSPRAPPRLFQGHRLICFQPFYSRLKKGGYSPTPDHN
jgi:hypothetical protein